MAANRHKMAATVLECTRIIHNFIHKLKHMYTYTFVQFKHISDHSTICKVF